MAACLNMNHSLVRTMNTEHIMREPSEIDKILSRMCDLNCKETYKACCKSNTEHQYAIFKHNTCGGGTDGAVIPRSVSGSSTYHRWSFWSSSIDSACRCSVVQPALTAYSLCKTWEQSSATNAAQFRMSSQPIQIASSHRWS
jgi:hypothetical protein